MMKQLKLKFRFSQKSIRLLSSNVYNFHEKRNRWLLETNETAFSVIRPFMTTSKNSSNRDRLNFFIDIIKKTNPAIVRVKKFAKLPFYSMQMGGGSGFLVDSDGLIVTNAHVIGMGFQIKVCLYNEKEYDAETIAVDRLKDIAIIKIESSNLPTIPITSTRKLEVGEWVLAMGSPLSLTNTATAGIVSNLSRSGQELGFIDDKKKLDYIQTDAVINFGNSGGPLINLDGEAVGVNTMVASAGIAFALPIRYVLPLLEQFKGGIQTKIEKRKSLGLQMFTITPKWVEKNKRVFSKVDKGVYIVSVEAGSPSEKAGVKENDIILSVNGVFVELPEEVVELAKISLSLDMEILRNNEKIKLRIITS